MKKRKECEHRCQELCHPGKPCPDEPCQAEIRNYCKCKNRFEVIICNSVEDRKTLECNAECLKKQRDERIANAFNTKKDFEENKDQF